jgi:hypothetical protein
LDRIVVAVPPVMTQHGHEITVRLDGQLAFTEQFADQFEANERWAVIEALLQPTGDAIDLLAADPGAAPEMLPG